VRDTPLTRLVVIGGLCSAAAYAALAISQAPLGSPVFFAIVSVPCIVYALLVWRLASDVERPTHDSRSPRARLFVTALLLAAAFRAPLLVRHVDASSDMVRYLYDGRVQRLGLNPYSIVPSDPGLAWTHTDETRRMPSRNDRTPYGAAAQLFFRLIVSIHESTRTMKLALVVCDLLTIAVLVAWLRGSGRSEWLALTYAWNPLVVLEIAHSGHIDALGMLLTAVSAWMLSTGRGARAAIAFAMAVATKLLPIVLLPIFWKRIRLRDAAAAAAVFALLYLPFASAATIPLGGLPNVVAVVRFNGPLFKALAGLVSPRGAAGIAVLAGLIVAGLMRRRREARDPATWAWPMAASLVAAPVIYPWYLLALGPFLTSDAVAPLTTWTISALPVYLVWDLSRHGHRWFVPWWLLVVEYGAVAIALTAAIVRSSHRTSGFQETSGFTDM
jgi:alpha-1,6-mannosyltransferase